MLASAKLDKAKTGLLYHADRCFRRLYASEHSTGTRINVSRVANPKPKITATAMGPHHWEDSPPISKAILRKSKLTPVAMGSSPRMVVTAVSMTGRNRVIPAISRASFDAIPLAMSWR